MAVGVGYRCLVGWLLLLLLLVVVVGCWLLLPVVGCRLPAHGVAGVVVVVVVAVGGGGVLLLLFCRWCWALPLSVGVRCWLALMRCLLLFVG